MMRRRVEQARVGRLATITASGDPHIVPICFALSGDTIVTAVDDKPKSTTALRRLDNVRAHGKASLLVDLWSEDWTALWWVRIDGSARVVDAEAELHAVLEPLEKKYRDQYGIHPPTGPAIVVEAERWRGWSAAP
jgi:PPOX class probable F420-dependent enzyme